MDKNKKNYLLIAFIFFITICFLTPISGDDYGNYISTNGSLISSIKLAISYYNTLEGRFIGRILIMYTTHNKIIWNILTPLFFTLLVSSSFKLLSKKTSYIIILLGLLILNTDMFSQSYTWLAGSITYLYPTSLILFYFITIYNKQNNYNKLDYIILILLSIIIPMFVENIGSVFVLGNIITLIYISIKEKKLNILYLITTIISSISLIIMLKSPGSELRSLTENLEFNNLTLIQKIASNIDNFNNYVFFKNSTMIIITLIPIVYYLIKKNHKILAVLISVIPILSIINNLYYILPMKFNFLQNINIISKDNNLYIIYWIIYLILFILSINYIIKNRKEKLFIYFILLLGLSSSIVMFILPTWGDRVTFFTVITLTLIGTILIDKIIKDNQRLFSYLKPIFICFTIYLLICFYSIYQINSYREIYINKQIKEEKETIEIIRNPTMYIWNNNPQSKYFIDTYKSYMNIDKTKEINLTQPSYKEYLKIILGVKK